MNIELIEFLCQDGRILAALGPDMNDNAPFSLWNSENNKPGHPSGAEFSWLYDEFDASRVTWNREWLTVETSKLPKPIPLTMAGLACIFRPLNDRLAWCGEASFVGTIMYVNPRMQDPSPSLQMPTHYSNLRKSQMASILEALMPICNVRRLIFVAGYTVVELVFGDGRVYGQRSLPGKVGGRFTTYHHSEE